MPNVVPKYIQTEYLQVFSNPAFLILLIDFKFDAVRMVAGEANLSDEILNTCILNINLMLNDQVKAASRGRGIYQAA